MQTGNYSAQYGSYLGLHINLVSKSGTNDLHGAVYDYIQNTVFTRNWGARLRDLLTPADWDARSALCEPDSPKNILRSPDYLCLYPITVFHCGSRP